MSFLSKQKECLCPAPNMIPLNCHNTPPMPPRKEKTSVVNPGMRAGSSDCKPQGSRVGA